MYVCMYVCMYVFTYVCLALWRQTRTRGGGRHGRVGSLDELLCRMRREFALQNARHHAHDTRTRNTKRDSTITIHPCPSSLSLSPPPFDPLGTPT